MTTLDAFATFTFSIAESHFFHPRSKVSSKGYPIDRYDQATGTYAESIRPGLKATTHVLSVTKGETVDFVVGRGAHFHYNGVGLRAQIDLLNPSEPEDERVSAKSWVRKKFSSTQPLEIPFSFHLQPTSIHPVSSYLEPRIHITAARPRTDRTRSHLCRSELRPCGDLCRDRIPRLPDCGVGRMV